MVAATLALTNCTKEIDQPNSGPESAGIPFELTASTVETKTALEGLQTVWATGDALNVFHAPAGSDQYVDDRKFTYSSDNKFKGSLSSEPSGSTDWYAFYPFGSYIVTPANTDAGYTNVWSKNGNTQNGNSNMSHLAGSTIPMYGKATVNAGEDVVVAMQHLTTVVKVVVTNTLDEELTVTNVAFTATEDVAGQYYIDFSGDEIVYTPRTGGSYVNNVAALEVSGAEALAKNETADFYIAMKPFTAQSGSKLYLSVNGTEKEITLPNDVTFNAGQIKTLTFDYDAVVLPTEITVEDFLDEEVSASKWYQIEGTISNIANTKYGNFDLEDDTGTIYVYGLLTEKGGDEGKFSTLGLKEGDVLTLIGQRGVHNDSPQVVNAYYVSHESCVAAPVISCEENTVTITAEAGATVYYTTDESDPVTSDTKQTYSAPFEIDETTDIKAYAVADGKPKSVVVSETCVFIKPDAPKPVTLTVSMTDYVNDNNCTISSGSDVTNYKSLQLDQIITMTAIGNANNEGSFWSGVQWRVYQLDGGGITVSAAAGYIIQSVKFTYTISNSGTLKKGDNQISSNTVDAVNASSVTYNVGNTGDKTNGQVRITQVEVVYCAN